MQYRNPYLDSMTAKVLLGDYFDTGRLPPTEVVAAVRHQSWRDLECKGGSLDVVGDRLYLLFFRSMCSKLSYVKVGRTKKEDKAQVRKRITAPEGEAKIALRSFSTRGSPVPACRPSCGRRASRRT